MSENLTDKVIGFMAVSGHKVDAETKLLLEQLDAGTLTYEEAIKRVYDAIEKIPTKKVVTHHLLLLLNVFVSFAMLLKMS